MHQFINYLSSWLHRFSRINAVLSWGVRLMKLIISFHFIYFACSEGSESRWLIFGSERSSYDRGKTSILHHFAWFLSRCIIVSGAQPKELTKAGHDDFLCVLILNSRVFAWLCLRIERACSDVLGVKHRLKNWVVDRLFVVSELCNRNFDIRLKIHS